MPSSSKYCKPAYIPPPKEPERYSGPRVHIRRSGGVETLSIFRTGPRMIEGIASTPRVSNNNHSLSSEGCIIRFPIPLLSSHGFLKDTRDAPFSMEQTRIGEIVWIQKSPRAIRVRAVVDHTAAGDYAWSLIERGETLCFSVAAKPGTLKLQGIVDGIRFFSEWELKEVSVCRRGANADCKFDIYRG